MRCDSRCELISAIRDLTQTEHAAVQCNRSEEYSDTRDAQGLSSTQSENKPLSKTDIILSIAISIALTGTSPRRAYSVVGNLGDRNASETRME